MIVPAYYSLYSYYKQPFWTIGCNQRSSNQASPTGSKNSTTRIKENDGYYDSGGVPMLLVGLVKLHNQKMFLVNTVPILLANNSFLPSNVTTGLQIMPTHRLLSHLQPAKKIVAMG